MRMRAVEHIIRRGLCTHHAARVNHTEIRRRSGPALLLTLIRRSAGKGRSAKFAEHAFEWCYRRCKSPWRLASCRAGEGREKEDKVVLIFADVRVDPKDMSQEELWEA